MTNTASSPVPTRAPLIDRVTKLLGARSPSGKLRGGLAATSTRAGGRRLRRRERSRDERVDGVRVARQRIERA